MIKTHKAFSMVEIMVVLAIVIILVLIAIPTIKTTLLTARRATCIGHLSQISIALHAYMNEHEQKLPGPQGTQIKANSNIPRLLFPYLTGQSPQSGQKDYWLEVWECPANTHLHDANKTNTPKITSYLANEQLFGYYPSGLPTVLPLTKLAILEIPAVERWLLRDIDAWNYVDNPNYGGNYPPVHNFGRNVLYADGRVEWVKSVKGQRP